MPLLDREEIRRLLAGDTLEIDGEEGRQRVTERLRLTLPVREFLAFRLEPGDRMLLYESGRDRYFLLDLLADCPADFPRRLHVGDGELRRVMREVLAMERSRVGEASAHGRATVGYYEGGEEIALLLEAEGQLRGWTGQGLDSSTLTLWASGTVV